MLSRGPRMRRIRAAGVFLQAAAVMLALGAASCEEHLPPRNDPGHVYSGTVIPSYTILQAQNRLYLTVELINTYDETLQDTADLTGTLEITLLRNPAITRTLTLGPASLTTMKYYDPFSRLLTVPSRDTLRLQVLWDFVDNNGVSLPLDVFNLYEDATCGGRWLGRPETFEVRGSVRVTKHTLVVSLPPRGFNLCYMSFITDRCPIPVTACDPEGVGKPL